MRSSTRLRRVRAALVGVGFCPMEALCTSEAALSLGARPRSDVPAAASNKQLSCACAQGITPLRALSLSREKAQHARLRRVRAALCWLDSVPALWKPTAPARRRSASVHGRAPTCLPRLPTSSFLAHVREKKTPPRMLSLSGEGAARALAVCARRAGWSRPLPYGSPLRQRDGPLPRCTAVLRRASRGLQRAAGVRVCAHANAPPRALSREEA